MPPQQFFFGFFSYCPVNSANGGYTDNSQQQKIQKTVINYGSISGYCQQTEKKHSKETGKRRFLLDF